MSRLGKKPLPIPEKVKVEFKDHALHITGPLGQLVQPLISPELSAKVSEKEILIEKVKDTREANMMNGLIRGLVKNAFEGVVTGFRREVEINGLGYKAAVEGKNLVMNVGFSHPVVFPIPEGAKVTVEKQSIVVTGIHKAIVGETAASIRAVKPAEPYTGTGLKYAGEQIIRKAGKAAAGGKK